MPELIERGHLFIAQPPLFKVARGRSEVYLKDQAALDDYLVEQGLDGALLRLGTGEEIQHTFQKTFQQTQTRRTTKNHRMRHTALCAAKPSPAHCSSWSTRGGSGTNNGSRGPWRRAGSRTTSHSRGSDGSIDWILQVVHQVTPVLNVIESCEKHSDFFSLLGCAVRYRPLQGVPSRKLARANVTRAAVRTRPMQYLEVSSARRHRARLLVPRAAVRAHPLQHLEVPAPRRLIARPPVPRATIRT